MLADQPNSFVIVGKDPHALALPESPGFWMRLGNSVTTAREAQGLFALGERQGS